MTIHKPKAKTLIERMGFNDPELTTPAHDEMFIVCMSSAQRIVDLVIESRARFARWRQMKRCLAKHELVYIPSVEQESKTNKSDVFKALSSLLYSPVRVVPEKPIVARNDFIIGFIDMLIGAKAKTDPETRFADIFQEEYINNSDYSHGSRSTTPVLRSQFSLDGIYDNHLDAFEHFLTEFTILVEIKPSIRSVGELIRQMQTYRQFGGENTIYVVISRTKAFKDVLAQANILLIDYEDVLPQNPNQ